MLVVPGMAPTTGGEGKSVIIQFVCYIVFIAGKRVRFVALSIYLVGVKSCYIVYIG